MAEDQWTPLSDSAAVRECVDGIMIDSDSAYDPVTLTRDEALKLLKWLAMTYEPKEPE